MGGQAHSQHPPEDSSRPDPAVPAKSPHRPRKFYPPDGITPAALKRLRATKMLELLVYGQPLAVIAVKFNTTPRAVRSHLRFIEREGLLAEVEETVVKDLLPLAAKAYRKALERAAETGNLSDGAARDMLKETGLLKRAGGLADSLRDDETIEALIIRRRTERAEVPGGSTPIAALPPADVVEGEVVTNPQTMDQQKTPA